MADAGKYTTLAELQEDVGGTEDSRGRPGENWQTRSRAWLLLQNIGSLELRDFNQRYPTATYRAETHYQPGSKFTAGWRMKLVDGRTLSVIDVQNEDNLNARWIIAAAEQVQVRD